jgi:ferredoxin
MMFSESDAAPAAAPAPSAPAPSAPAPSAPVPSAPPAVAPSAGNVSVTFVEDAATCPAASGSKLTAIAKAAKVAIFTGFSSRAQCHGIGICGACRVGVDPAAALSAPTWFERFTLGPDCGKQRLACQARAVADVQIKLKPARDYAEVYRALMLNGLLIGGFSILALGFLVVMLLDIVGKLNV